MKNYLDRHKNRANVRKQQRQTMKRNDNVSEILTLFVYVSVQSCSVDEKEEIHAVRVGKVREWGYIER